MTQDNEGIIKHLLDLHGTVGTPSHVITYKVEGKQERKNFKKTNLTGFNQVLHFLKLLVAVRLLVT